MITVYHESWVVTLGILFPKTWQKNIFFSVGKKSFLGGMSKWLQLYIGGVRPNDNSVTRGRGDAQMITILHRGEGSLGTPKSDYVICAQPLMIGNRWDRCRKVIGSSTNYQLASSAISAWVGKLLRENMRIVSNSRMTYFSNAAQKSWIFSLISKRPPDAWND